MHAKLIPSIRKIQTKSQFTNQFFFLWHLNKSMPYSKKKVGHWAAPEKVQYYLEMCCTADSIPDISALRHAGQQGKPLLLLGFCYCCFWASRAHLITYAVQRFSLGQCGWALLAQCSGIPEWVLHARESRGYSLSLHSQKRVTFSLGSSTMAKLMAIHLDLHLVLYMAPPPSRCAVLCDSCSALSRLQSRCHGTAAQRHLSASQAPWATQDVQCVLSGCHATAASWATCKLTNSLS